jgi:hypothetical protein
MVIQWSFNSHSIVIQWSLGIYFASFGCHSMSFNSHWSLGIARPYRTQTVTMRIAQFSTFGRGYSILDIFLVVIVGGLAGCRVVGYRSKWFNGCSAVVPQLFEKLQLVSAVGCWLFILVVIVIGCHWSLVIGH